MDVGRLIRTVKMAAYAPLLWAIGRVVGARHCRDPMPRILEEVAAGQAVLLDVRETAEWARGHLRDAILLPLSRLRVRRSVDDWRSQIPTGRPIYVHCGAGGRSLIAASILAAHGYDARALKPGFDDLVQAGFPTTS